jgi:ABC-type sugar transport system substrate-binding protein
MKIPLLSLSLLSLSACSEEVGAVLASADGRWRVVHVVEAGWQQEQGRAAMAAALERLPAVDLVFAHDDELARGAWTAAQQQGRAGIRSVGIGALPEAGRRYVADGQLDATIENPTCAGAAIDLALLACNGVQLPRRIAVGTRVWTRDDLATGGDGRLSPGEFMLANLRSQHSAVLTTKPAHDQVFRIGMAQCGPDDDPWLRAARAELQAWAGRYPQVQFDFRKASGTEQQRELVAAFVALGCNAILVAPAPAALAASCRQAIGQGIVVIALDLEPGIDDYTVCVGGDDLELGRQAGAEIQRLLPQGGAIAVIQGPMDSLAARRRHQGFVEALGLVEVH